MHKKQHEQQHEQVRVMTHPALSFTTRHTATHAQTHTKHTQSTKQAHTHSTHTHTHTHTHTQKQSADRSNSEHTHVVRVRGAHPSLRAEPKRRVLCCRMNSVLCVCGHLVVNFYLSFTDANHTSNTPSTKCMACERVSE